MKKTFYLITEKSFNNNNIVDVGVFIEKIVLSTESEDYEEFSKDSFQGTQKEMFENYVENFQFYIHDELEEEKRKSREEEFPIYNHILLDEEQYKMLMKQNEDIPTREISVFEISNN